MRITGFLTNTPPGGPHRQLADLELRYRRHAVGTHWARTAGDGHCVPGTAGHSKYRPLACFSR